MTTIDHPFARALLPLNAEQISATALTYADRLGELYGVSVTLLFVLELAGHSAGAGFADETPEQSENRINTLVNQKVRPLLQSAEIERLIIRQGKAADEIIAVADELDVDIVLMGSRGKTGLQHMIMGSVTEKVVHLINRPVLTIPVRE